MAVLLVCATENLTVTLDKPVLLVGRHPDCDVQIESQKVSRRHCCVAQVNGEIVVRDLGSTNGIRLNGSVVQEARLSLGDELSIGNVRFRLEQDEEQASKRSANGAHERLAALGERQDPVSSDVPILLPDDEDLEDMAPEIRTVEPDDKNGPSPFIPTDSDEIDLAPSDHGLKGG